MIPSISVIYLCYLPYGIECLVDFITSYKLFDAGVEHQLTIVFKGGKLPDETSLYIDYLHQQHITFNQLLYNEDGLDVATYCWAAQQVQSEYVFFLNTRSKIIASNWLLHFYNASQKYSAFILGATGSWQSHVSVAFKRNTLVYEGNKSVRENIRKYKQLIKAGTIGWFHYPLFPNPHIRTNAFYINRQLFLSLNFGHITTKSKAHYFESGRKGFTRRLKMKGFNVAIVSKNGEIFTEKEWRKSNIFFSGNQENLIIADNLTEVYAKADATRKAFLRKLFWE